MSYGLRLAATFLGMALLSHGVQAAEWSDYRGPDADGHSDAKGLPLEWSEGKNIKWKTPIPGKGWSSPVVLGKHLWMTTATEDGSKMYAVCVDRASGKIVLNPLVFENDRVQSVNQLNSYASPSPVTEEGRVYVYFGTYGVAALDAKTGKTIWSRRDLVLNHSQGPGSSPILYQNLLIFHCDGTDVQYITALDKKTGKTVWKTDRSHDLSGVSPEQRKSYATPRVVSIGGKDQLISQAAQCLFGYEPATGKEIWQFRYNGYSNVPRPLVHDNLIIISSGYDNASMIAVKTGGAGDITQTHRAWTHDNQVPRRPSSLVVDGRVYLVADNGVASCLDAASGKVIWEKQRVGGEYSASPLYADGKIYFFSQQGHTTVLQPGTEFKVLSVNKLEAGCMASPAVADQAIYLRTKTALYRIEGQ